MVLCSQWSTAAIVVASASAMVHASSLGDITTVRVISKPAPPFSFADQTLGGYIGVQGRLLLGYEAPGDTP